MSNSLVYLRPLGPHEQRRIVGSAKRRRDINDLVRVTAAGPPHRKGTPRTLIVAHPGSEHQSTLCLDQEYLDELILILRKASEVMRLEPETEPS